MHVMHGNGFFTPTSSLASVTARSLRPQHSRLTWVSISRGYSFTPTFGYSFTPRYGYSFTPRYGYSFTPRYGNSFTPRLGNSFTPCYGYSFTPCYGYSFRLGYTFRLISATRSASFRLHLHA